MAITRPETQVEWGGANSVSVAAGTDETSDVVTLHATCVAAQVSIKCDGPASPASDDYINFWLLQTSGDPDGTAGADEYDTLEDGHAVFLVKLDTSIAADSATDVVIATRPLPIPQASFKLVAQGSHADTTTNAIVVSATITEQRVA